MLRVCELSQLVNSGVSKCEKNHRTSPITGPFGAGTAAASFIATTAPMPATGAAARNENIFLRFMERMLGCEYNTAWFLHHRVMEAMRRGGLELPPMGGPGSVVEVDEAYHGRVDEARVSTPVEASASPLIAVAFSGWKSHCRAKVASSFDADSGCRAGPDAPANNAKRR